MLWGGIGAGVVVLLVIVLLASNGSGGKKTKPTDRNEVASMDQITGPVERGSAGNNRQRNKTVEERGAERREEEEDRIDRLVRRLDSEVDPSVVKNEADWATVQQLISEAESLVGVRAGDRRARPSGSIEDKRAAKAKAEEAHDILEENSAFRSLIKEYDQALTMSDRFAFFSEVRNRINFLKLRLKGL